MLSGRAHCAAAAVGMEGTVAMGWSDGSAMTADDLRWWMNRYGFSNTMLATHLGVGLSTVKRWKRRGAPKARLLELALDGLLYESGRLP